MSEHEDTFPREREAWRMEFTFEFRDEEEANEIFEAFLSHLESINFTHWSARMVPDDALQKALVTFRENKEDILANLPPAVVEAYYPDWNDSCEIIEEREPERHLSVVPELEEE
jgi:hypothetical protein